MATRMQQRRGTAADWAAANPVLADGEIGFETDTKVFKIGDGVTAWAALGQANTFRPATSAAVGFIVKGVASQTGDLEQWQDDTGAVLSKVGADGSFTANGTGLSLRVAPNDLQFNRAGARSYISQLGIAGTINILGSTVAAADTSMGQFDPVNGVTIGDVGGVALALPAAAIRLRLKAAPSQTADVQQWLDSANAVMARIGPTGLLEAKQGLQSTAPVPGNVPLIVKGAVGQTASMQTWVDSSNNIVAQMTNFGGLALGPGAPTTARLNLLTLSPGTVGILVRAAASPTANLMELQDSTGALLTRVSSFGGIHGAVVAGTATTGLPAASHTLSQNATGNVALAVKRIASAATHLQTWVDENNNVLAAIRVNGSLGLPAPGGTLAPGAFWAGSGAPATGSGAIGDFYFRSDTPTTANQRVYIKTAAAVWTGII